MRQSNEILKKAFMLADIDDFECIPNEFAEWSPSIGFERKMSKLKRSVTNPFWEYVNTAGKRAAIIILASVIFIGSAMSIKAVREAAFRFIAETYEKFTRLFAESEGGDTPYHIPPKEIEKQYAPTYLPMGFALNKSELDEFKFEYKTEYTNAEQTEKIKLSQFILGGTQIGVNTENSKLNSVDINGYQGYYTVSNSEVILIWTTDDYIFQMILPEKITVQEALKIAKSIS